MGKRFILGGIREEIEPEAIWATRKRRRILEKWYQERLGFEFRHVLGGDNVGIISGSEQLPKDTEVIFLSFALHSYSNKSAIRNIMEYLKLNKKAKIIYETAGDRRMWHYKREEIEPFLKRCNVILDNQKESWKLNPHNTVFINQWPQYARKHIFFPECFAPHETFADLKYNKQPLMKCIMSGRPGGRYELRNHIICKIMEDEELKGNTDVIRHPQYVNMTKRNIRSYVRRKYKSAQDYDYRILVYYSQLDFVEEGQDARGNIINEEYAKCLNRYFCGLGINGGRKCQIIIMKHLEIPAAGALLLSERFLDLDRAGFVSGQHYVEISATYHDDVETNAVDIVRMILKNPKEYEKIRRSGMKFVRENHSINNRYEQFVKILEGVLR